MVRKKIFNVIIVVIAVLFVWFFIRFVIGGPEDTWICDNQQWVKHGAPSAPKPQGQCDWLDNLNPFR